MEKQIEERLYLLTERETEALNRWLSKEMPPIAVSTAAKMFEIFLQGQTCEQIHKLNPTFEYGAIIHARLRDGWDDRRADYVSDLYGSIREKVGKSQLEAIDMMTNLLSTTAKRNNEKYLRFLQTQDEKELTGAIGIKSLKEFKEAVESIRMLTGQDKKPEANPVTNISGAQKVEVIVQENSPKNILPARDTSLANSIIKRALKSSTDE